MTIFNDTEEVIDLLTELKNFSSISNLNQKIGKYDYLDRVPMNKRLFKNLYSSYRIFKKEGGHKYAVDTIAHFSTKDAVIVDYLFR